MKSEDLYITASELGDYVYCSRGWWLRVNGLLKTNQAMVEGQKQHAELANSLSWFNMKMLLTFGLILIGVALAIIAILFLVLFHG